MWKPLLALAVVAIIGFITPTRGHHCNDNNEVFSNCTNSGCGPTTCDGLGNKIGCIKMDQKNCKKGYVCKDGYLRDDNGNCIPKAECPECGGDPNAVSGCGQNCGKHCTDIGKGPRPCTKICNVDACDCRDGFFYDENSGKCVLPEDCSTPVCGENEVFSDCVNGGCDARNCSQVGKPVACVKPKTCFNGCICKDGWLRADDGTCIPKEQCPNSCNKPHEYYDDCVKSCSPQTCDSIGQIFNCPLQTTVCKGACRCEDGYYRDEGNNCIPKQCCTSCGGDPNAKPGCGVNCGRLCSNYKKKDVVCTLQCDENGCDCKKGFVFDDNIKKCVRPEKCTPQCPDGEIYEKCPDITCKPLKCSQLGFSLNCTTDGNCPGEPGCICNNGNVRDYKGNCIPIDQCPSCGGDPNAVSGCSNYCGNRCSDYKQKKKILCPLFCLVNGCACKDGFVFDGNLNKCVRPKDCTETCGTNEVYNTCANGGCRKRTCSTPKVCIDPVKCKGGCICQDGYTRDKNNTCIPEDQCPAPQCPDGETYEKCPDNNCRPQKCSDLGLPLNCIVTSDGDCRGEPGCICNNSYVRDDQGNCVPIDQCSSCGGDPNAVSGCSNYCGNSCSDYKEKNNKPCPLFCRLNGCACKDGFVFDGNLNKCVRPKDCTKTCGTNEVYNTCANGGCRKLNCSKPKVCIDRVKCKGGCICQDGYTRDKNNTCIPEDQCPEKCDDKKT